MISCPNVNLKEWIDLVESVGETNAYGVWNAYPDGVPEKFYKKTQPIKEGVDFVFEQNPELTSIGSPEQYSAYLDTVFPDSKVRDIIYHGTKDRTFSLNKKPLDWINQGNFFTTKIREAKKYGKDVVPAIINSNIIEESESSNYINGLKINEKADTISLSLPYYTGKGFETEGNYLSYAVFNLDQIHILGSKQDIEGFKEFIGDKNLGNPNAYKSIEIGDSNLKDYEKQLGFVDKSGNRKYFMTLAAANKYLETLPKDLKQFITRHYDIVKSLSQHGAPNERFVKHILTLRRRNPNIILDTVYGEFNTDTATQIKNDIFSNQEQDNSQNVLQRVVESGLLSEEIKEVAKLLSDVNVPVEFISNDTNILMDTDGTVIRVNLTALANAHPLLVAEGILHELVHIKTVNAVENPQTQAEIFLSKRVRYLFNRVKELDKESRYGFTNEVEFIAELLAKKEFRQYVKSLEQGNLWERFKAFMAQFFGIKTGSTKLISLLEEVISKEVEVKRFKTRNLEVESSTRKHLGKIIDSVGTRMKTLEFRKVKSNFTETRPSKEQLQQELQNNSHSELAEIYHVSIDTINLWLTTDPKTYKGYTYKKYEEVLENLKKKYNDHKDLEGITEYLKVLEQFLEEFDEVSIEMRRDIDSRDYDKILARAGTIRTLGTFIDSNIHIIDQLFEGLKIIKQENPESKDAIKDIERILGLATGELKQLRGVYKDASKVIFAKFLVPFGLGKSLEHIEEVLETPVKDIGWLSKSLNNMQESRDEALGMIDVALKTFYIEAAQENLAFEKDILEAKKKLEDKGISDTNFMIKKDSKGKNSHYFITERDIVDFREARDILYKTLVDVEKASDPKKAEEGNKAKLKEFYKKYTISSKYNKDEFNKLIASKKSELGDKFEVWLALNSITNSNDDSINIPRKIDREYTALHNNEFKSEFYWKLLSSKYNLEKHLPESKKHLRRLPQMRKDLIEKIKNGNWNRMLELVKENFKIKEDDTEYGADYGLTDEAGNIINFLPIYFVNKVPNPEDLSLDVTSSMIAYNYFYNKREKLSTIVDMLELGKDVIKRRGVYRTSNRGNIIKSIKKFTGNKQEESQIQGPGNVYERLETYLEMFLYGKEKVEGDTLLGVNVEKFLDVIGKYTGVRVLAGNVYASLANINTGTVLTIMEGIEGKFYDKEAYAFSEKEYWANMLGVLGDIGSRTATGKMTLWSEYMDSMNNIEERVYGVEAERKTRVGQLMNSSALYLTSKLPEHYLHNRISLAIANTYRFDKKTNRFVFKDEFFKELIELDNEQAKEIRALEGKHTSEQINNIKDKYKNKKDSLKDKLNAEWKTMENYWSAWETKGTRLVLKEEFKNDFSKEDQIKFINRQHSVNNTIQGMYSKLDKSPIQRYALGRLGMMFRRFFVPAFNRRFIGKYTDFEKQMEVEGYFRVVARFINELRKDIKSGSYSLSKSWNSLTNEEKSSMFRALQDVIFLTSIAILGAILMNMKGDDDDWILNMAAYQVNRLFTEIGAMVPPFMFKEMFKILNAPAAGFSTVQQIYDILSISPFEYGRKIEQGKYKDLYVYQRSLIKTIPMAETGYSLFYPEEKLKYFTSPNW